MSTKIHHGWRITGGRSPFDVVQDLRDHIEPIYRDLYLTNTAGLAAGAVDAMSRGALPESLERAGRVQIGANTVPWMYALLRMEEAHREVRRTGLRNPALDLQCEATLLRDPAADSSDSGTLYVLFFAEQQEYADAFGSVEGVEPWPYWDNTDRPDGISEAAWTTRRETWDRVVGSDAPARRGLSWSLLGDMHPVTFRPADLMPYLPSTTARAHTLACRSTTGWTQSEGMAVLLARVRDLAATLEPELAPITVEQLSGTAPDLPVVT